MTIRPDADVDDDLVAHVDAALDGGGAHVGQEHDLALGGELDEFGIDRRLVLEDVEPANGHFGNEVTAEGEVVGLDRLRVDWLGEI